MKTMIQATNWSTTWHGMMSLEHFLDPREVKRARLKEIEYIRSKGVNCKISREEA